MNEILTSLWYDVKQGTKIVIDYDDFKKSDIVETKDFPVVRQWQMKYFALLALKNTVNFIKSLDIDCHGRLVIVISNDSDVDVKGFIGYIKATYFKCKTEVTTIKFLDVGLDELFEKDEFEDFSKYNSYLV